MSFQTVPASACATAIPDEQANSQSSLLVCLKNGVGGLPLFVVHGIGGAILELSTIGKLIHYDGPIYAVQATGIDGRRSPLRTVEAMAECYLRAIREIQHSGPYLLSGYSLGGLIAVEMARCLLRSREPVDLLLLIDAYASRRTWPMSTRAHVFMRRLTRRSAELANGPWRALPMYMLKKIGEIRHLADRHDGISELRQAGRHPQRPSADLAPALQEVYMAAKEARETYMPRFYPGKITFIKAQNNDPVFPPDPVPIWRHLAKEFELHCVPGDHLTILEQHAHSSAARMSICLARVRSEAPDAKRLQVSADPPAASRGLQVC